MARTITALAQTALDTQLGTEVIVVLEIFWASTDGTATGPSSFYADRAIDGGKVKGSILSMANFDEAVQVTGGGQAASFNVVLDDTDGSLKAIFDANDIHKAPVKVWLFPSDGNTTFAADKIPVFLGQINSPVEWSEGQRTLSLSVVNRIEDVEVGFSAEEGEFPALPEELIGRPWPLCFGTTINVPALKAVPAISGKLAGGVGISDFTLAGRILLAEDITCPQTPIGFKCTTQGGAGQYSATCNIAFETDQGCLQARCVEIERLKLMKSEQESYEYPTITIFGGEQFPQGRTIELNINGGIFQGSFGGTLTSPSNVFTITKRTHPDYDSSTGTVAKKSFQTAIESACPGSDYEAEDSDFTDTAFGPVFTGLRSSRVSWEAYREADQASFFWAGGGSTVTLETSKDIIYIANIVPSTILRVAAWRTLNGNRFLLTVPDKYFTTRQVNYVGYQVMEIVFQRPLSNEDLDSGGGWTDDVYVTQVSSVGPNTVDIIEWFIDTYTSYSKDTSSFTSVQTALENYPMHFALLSRPNLLNILQDLAQKARCALWQKLDTFYIKYLADEPTSIDTIEEADVLADEAGVGSMIVTLTPTEDLVTKLTCKWRRDYSLRDDWTLILRHKTKRYGTHAREENYFPYGHLDLVRKSATFWLIRWANTWKRVRLSVPLSFLKLEPFDTVTLDLPDISGSTFKAIVEKATLDTTNNQIDLELWTPIRAGETTPYNFAWPADISEHAIFPTDEARDANEAGSGTEPNFSTISPPGHPLRSPNPGVFSGFALGCNGDGVISLEPGKCRQDHGDGKPSDIGDTKPTVDASSDTSGGVSDGTEPVTNGAGYGYSSWTYQNGRWNEKLEGDAGRGREYASMNDSNNTGDGHGTGDQTTTQDVDDDFLDDLPDPDDVDGCVVQVEARGFDTRLGGVVASPTCLPAGGERIEIYAFDNTAAALEFCENFTDASTCGTPPCSYCKLSCGIISISGECDAGEGSDGLVGFRPDPSFGDNYFMGRF
ncbi:MAG: hypothetical protein ACYSUX_08775 [Planctomycetota bacterium]|jgi:hypothetical protein